MNRGESRVAGAYVLAVVVSCAAIALLTAEPAPGAQALLMPSDLARTGERLQRPIVAISPDGDAVVAAMYEYRNNLPDSNNECCYSFDVQATSGIWVGSEWQAPATISNAGQGFIPRSVAMDANDDAAVVWPGGGRIDAAFRSGGSVIWQAPVAISGEGADFASIAFDEQNNLTAVWEQTGGGPYAAVRSAASGMWQSSVDLAPANHETVYPSNVVVNPQGDAIVAWGSGGVIQIAARRGQQGTWQAPVTISLPNPPANVEADDPDVALNDQGEAIVAWNRTIRQSATESISTVQTATGSIDSGVWQAPVEQPPASLPEAPPPRGRPYRGIIPGAPQGHGTSFPQVALDTRGDAVAMWRDVDSNSSAVQASIRPAEGAWQGAVNVSLAGEEPEEPELAGDAKGDTVVAWYAQGVIAATVRQPSGSWQEPVDISAEDEVAGNYPQLAINARGDAIVTWEGPEAFGFDAREPLPSERPPKPTIYEASLINTRFRVAPVAREERRSPPVTRQRPATSLLSKGTTIDLGLSAAAQVTISVERVEPGVRHGHTCVVSPLKLERKKEAWHKRVKSCTETAPVGGAVSAEMERSGARTLRFSGRFGEREQPLSPGKYEAVLFASNASGTSQRVTLPFAIVP